MLVSRPRQRSRINWLHVVAALLGLVLGWTITAWGEQPASQGDKKTPTIQAAQLPAHRLQALNERLEMMVNTSRIVTLDEQIPKLTVDNPDMLTAKFLSATEVRISAKTAGSWRVNLVGMSGKIYTLDIVVVGDANELETLLRSQFPYASLKVQPLPSTGPYFHPSVSISGNADDLAQMNQIIDIAEDFYPKVHNKITVRAVPVPVPQGPIRDSDDSQPTARDSSG